MPYLFVGAGQAGSAIVDEIFGHKNIRRIATPLVFNSTVRDLQNLSNIGEEFWYGIAEQYGLVPGTTEGFEERVTGGFGRNPVEALRKEWSPGREAQSEGQGKDQGQDRSQSKSQSKSQSRDRSQGRGGRGR